MELSLSDQVQEFTVTKAVSKKKTVVKDSTTAPLTKNQRAIKDGFLAGKKAGEVAEELGVSPSYVYTQYKKMKDELDLTA
ncbi:hypothetical protein CVT30_29425 [Streptomyces sp. AMCC400023]|nr:hypothetical protein CVT30_29425 [Streptomyces sp. AMCC400023]